MRLKQLSLMLTITKLVDVNVVKSGYIYLIEDNEAVGGINECVKHGVRGMRMPIENN